MTQPTHSVPSGAAILPRLPLRLAAVGAVVIASVSLLGIVGALPVATVDGAAVRPVPAAAVSAVLVWVVIAAALVAVSVRSGSVSSGSVSSGSGRVAALSAAAALGAMSVGSLVADAQLLVRAIDADRLDLARPATAAALTVAPGSVVLIVGRLVVIVAGALAAVALARSGAGDGDPVLRGASAPVGIAAVVAVLALAASALLPAYISSDPVVLAPAPVSGPVLLAVGASVSAVSVLVVAAVALSSGSGALAVGAAVGVLASVASVVVVRIAAAIGAGDRIDVGPGVVVGVVGLVVAGVGLAGAASRRDRAASERPRSVIATRGRRVDVHVAAGIAVIVSGVTFASSTALPLLSLSAQQVSVLQSRSPDAVGERAVTAFALVTVCAGILLLFSEFAAAVRPAAALIVVGLFTVSGTVLQALVLGVGIDGVAPGAGGWALVAACVVALASLALLVVAGADERDRVDTSDLPGLHGRPVIAVGAAAGLSVIGLVLPQYSVDGAAAGWIGSWPWGWDVWARLLLAACVTAATIVACRARRERAVALVVGSALAVGAVAGSAAAGAPGADIAPSVGATLCAAGAVASALVAAVMSRTGE